MFCFKLVSLTHPCLLLLKHFTSASTEANMDHGPKHKSKKINRAEDAKASHEAATIWRINRLEVFKKLREDVLSIIEQFMEDGFQVLDRLKEEFLESDGDTAESDGDTAESDGDTAESDGDARESEFSESEPEMLPGQTFPEEEPVASSADIEQAARPEKTQAAVTLSGGNQTVAPEGKSSTSEREQESDPEIRPRMPRDRKRTVRHDRQDLQREQGTQTESAEDAPARGLLRTPLRRTLRALGRRLQEAGEE